MKRYKKIPSFSTYIFKKVKINQLIQNDLDKFWVCMYLFYSFYCKYGKNDVTNTQIVKKIIYDILKAFGDLS